MPRPTEPEILLPRSRRGASLFTDENLDYLSHILDDFLRIPGTNIRFGLDGVIGLIPGIGDVLGAMASWIIILAAWLRGVPNITLARMLANVAIETIVGAVPILGDAFDIAWKANRRNFALLERSASAPHQHTTRDWAFLLLLLCSMMFLLAIPILLLAWLVGRFFALGAHSAH
jgi:hypothetical protein